MKAINRKLIRDLRSMKGQVAAICLVIASGVATFVMSLSTLESLTRTQERYYSQYRFAHIFTHLKRAPKALHERIAAIPGVAHVQTRIVADVTLDVPGLDEPAVGRLISIPERRPPEVNRVHLRRGRYIEARQPGEVLINEAFADAHGLQPGDQLSAVINARYQRLKIVGVALSPEYVFQIRQGDFLPDEKRFGVFWMGEEELAAAFDMEGAFNDLTLTLMHGASEADVIQRLDRLLEPYGSLGAYDRSEQISNRYLSDEIKQLRGMGMVAPIIFLAVAAFLLNVTLSRLINTQREEIAVLKAFGYSHWEVGLHYLKLVLLIVVAGVAIGSIAGGWMGRNLTELYTRFYRFPVFDYEINFGVVSWALVISAVAATLGTLSAIRRAVVLPPAEAMRPEPPQVYRPTLVERIGLQELISPRARMILRHLERQPVKAALSTLGISMAVAVLILGSFMEDSLDFLIQFQFHLSQRQDMTLALVEPRSGEALYEVQQLPGVLFAEPMRSVPVRLRSAHRSRRLAIMGLPQPSRLFRVFDAEESVLELPREGMVVSAKLAELLDVRVGDRVTAEILEDRRPVFDIVVSGLVNDFAGLSAYMEIGALNGLMNEGNTVSGAFLHVDGRFAGRLYRQLKQTPQVANVSVKEATLQSFRDTIAENLMRIRAFNILFASIIAIGVVYNSARISLSERSRELATLRVIGFTRAEISGILLGELAVLTLTAIPLGMVLGYVFGVLVSLTLDTEIYRIPLVIQPSTYAFAAVVIMMAALISGLIVRRRLDRLDLIAVLKTRE